MKGETLSNFLSADAKVVLNPKNSSEYRITEKDMTWLLFQAEWGVHESR